MAKSIRWSRIAEYRLRDIYDYYSCRVSTDIANKIVLEVIDASLDLLHAPYSGQKEPLIASRRFNYRYMIKNYKIIYRVEETDESIFVIDVFDTRQSPGKLQDVSD